ncbi:putative LMBR1-like membrane protein [Paratrimastix pyriformis]|uniref:LMBR1-like membrane protein n=1 Tax=Paratrimastix pyriformis TaxID=342808 RepID=A0ABQ8US63_9EUKA|nr:putative LMBR1-like membrane protein [Paratrimastix pyriformis]
MGLFFVLSESALVVCAIFLFRYLASRKYFFGKFRPLSTFTMCLVIFSWVISLSIIVLLPDDLAVTFRLRCRELHDEEFCDKIFVHSFLSPQALVVMYRCLYWLNFFMTWVAIPVLQDFTKSCQFTFVRRLWDGIKFNLIIYSVAGIIGVIFLIYFAATRELTWNDIPALGIAASNAYALTFLVGLMGVGFVTIPRRLWNYGNIKRSVLRSQPHPERDRNTWKADQWGAGYTGWGGAGVGCEIRLIVVMPTGRSLQSEFEFQTYKHYQSLAKSRKDLQDAALEARQCALATPAIGHLRVAVEALLTECPVLTPESQDALREGRFANFCLPSVTTVPSAVPPSRSPTPHQAASSAADAASHQPAPSPLDSSFSSSHSSSNNRHSQHRTTDAFLVFREPPFLLSDRHVIDGKPVKKLASVEIELAEPHELNPQDTLLETVTIKRLVAVRAKLHQAECLAQKEERSVVGMCLGIQFRDCVAFAALLNQVQEGRLPPGFRSRLKYLWYGTPGRILMRICAVLLSMLSVLVLLGESVIMVDTVDLSPISLLVHSAFPGLLELVALTVVAYMSLCAFTTLVRLRIFNFYHLVPGASEAYSLLFCANYNFLTVIHELHSTSPTKLAFYKIVSVMDVVPILGNFIIVYLPLAMWGFVVLTLFNCFPRVLKLLRIPQFGLDEEHDEEMAAKGRAIIAASGAAPPPPQTATYPLPSSSYSSSASSSRPGSARFNLLDFHHHSAAPSPAPAPIYPNLPPLPPTSIMGYSSDSPHPAPRSMTPGPGPLDSSSMSLPRMEEEPIELTGLDGLASPRLTKPHRLVSFR